MEYDIKIMLGILALVVAFCVITVVETRRRKERFWQKAKQEFGELPFQDYNLEELDSFSHYYRSRQKTDHAFTIDDITWNDLDMDRIFLLLNKTGSSIGSEYLYDMLRRPCFQQDILLERKRLAEYFAENEQKRIRIQYIFHELGRVRRIGFSDYIERLQELDAKSNLRHYVMIGIIIGYFLLSCVNVSYGVPCLILAVVFNIIDYYRHKGAIEPYLICFTYLLRMLKSAELIGKIPDKELLKYTKGINDITKQWKRFKRNAFWVSGSGRDAGGGLEQVIIDYIRMVFHPDLIKFNQMLVEVQNKSEDIDKLFRLLGELEAAIAVANFKAWLPYYAEPELTEGGKAVFYAEGMYHPLLSNPVANSIQVDRNVLLTGSNASGKSTFLKSAAICSILAQTIYACPCRSYKNTYFRTYSSMALRDDIQSGESYFIVEIKSLKRILDAAGQSAPVLCFVDEVLRGTNTVERIAASAQVLKSLVRPHVLVFAATHDIELTYMLEDTFENYHFTEEISENDVVFHYELLNGRADSRNAINLLKIIGYDETIVKRAKSSAEKFLQEGVWEC